MAAQNAEEARYHKDVLALAADHPWHRLRELVPPGSAVLDIGCGSGDLGRFLADRASHVDGLEPSAERAEVARRYLRRVVNGVTGGPTDRGAGAHLRRDHLRRRARAHCRCRRRVALGARPLVTERPDRRTHPQQRELEVPAQDPHGRLVLRRHRVLRPRPPPVLRRAHGSTTSARTLGSSRRRWSSRPASCPSRSGIRWPPPPGLPRCGPTCSPGMCSLCGSPRPRTGAELSTSAPDRLDRRLSQRSPTIEHRRGGRLAEAV